MNIIESLQWRYATKLFDASKKIAKEDIDTLKEVIRLSPSSYGLQLYKVLIVEDNNLRERLKAASWNQNQITDASHLVIFCNYVDVQNKHIDEYIQLKADTENIKANTLKGYGSFMKSKIDEKSQVEIQKWTSNQTYLALGNLLSACASLKIDACPMEGFEPEEYNKILKLSKHNLNAAVIATIGYRSEKDETQFSKKVRKSKSEIFDL